MSMSDALEGVWQRWVVPAVLRMEQAELQPWLAAVIELSGKKPVQAGQGHSLAVKVGALRVVESDCFRRKCLDMA